MSRVQQLFTSFFSNSSLIPTFFLDIGEGQCHIIQKGKNHIHSVPSVLLYNIQTHQYLYTGEQAAKMIGRVTEPFTLHFPIQNKKVAHIQDMTVFLQSLLDDMKERVSHPFLLSQFVVSSPFLYTSMHKDVFTTIASKVGVRLVDIIPNPIAIVKGAGCTLTNNSFLVLDYGVGGVELAVVSLGKVVASRVIPYTQNQLLQSIRQVFLEEHGMETGYNTSLQCLKTLSSIGRKVSVREMVVRGKDIQTGLPTSVQVQSTMFIPIFENFVKQTINEIVLFLESISPDITTDLVECGVVLSGGISTIRGLKEYLEEKLRLPFIQSKTPTLDVIKGMSME